MTSVFLSVSGAKSVEGEQERECVCGREALTAKGRSSVCLAAAAAAAVVADGAKRQARLQPNCYVPRATDLTATVVLIRRMDSTLKCKLISKRLRETYAGGQREPGGGIRETS